MARTVVGVAANLCPVDAEGKNIHSSVSCKFAESIRQVGGLPLVCLLYTSPSPRDPKTTRMPSSA